MSCVHGWLLHSAAPQSMRHFTFFPLPSSSLMWLKILPFTPIPDCITSNDNDMTLAKYLLTTFFKSSKANAGNLLKWRNQRLTESQLEIVAQGQRWTSKSDKQPCTTEVCSFKMSHKAAASNFIIIHVESVLYIENRILSWEHLLQAGIVSLLSAFSALLLNCELLSWKCSNHSNFCFFTSEVNLRLLTL